MASLLMHNIFIYRWYRSMVDPKSDTQYTCRILDNGIEPKVRGPCNRKLQTQLTLITLYIV